MRVAVVIPTLDEADRLPRLLDALGVRGDGPPGAALDVPDEVVVVDGGSRDQTVRLAEQRGVRVLSAARGRGVQLALGARHVDSDVILFLHADSFPLPGSVAALRQAFEQGDQLATGMRQRIESPRRFYRLVERAANFRVRRGMVYGDSALAVRRTAYEEVGGFADLPLFEDLDLSRRLRRRGAVRLLEDACVVVSARRWQAEGALRRTLWNWGLTTAWFLGVDPARLVRYYRPHSGLA